jgi:hypothetical protein
LEAASTQLRHCEFQRQGGNVDADPFGLDKFLSGACFSSMRLFGLSVLTFKLYIAHIPEVKGGK